MSCVKILREWEATNSAYEGAHFYNVSGLQPVTLLKNELLKSHFLKILSSFKEHLFKPCGLGIAKRLKHT